jgi:hypothetical protein
MKTKSAFITITILLLLSLAACAPGTNVDPNDPPNRQIEFTTPGPNPEVGTPTENGPSAGLGTGLFHGLISVITLIISFFNPEVQMYEVHNTGPLYNLGFLLGAVLLFTLLGYGGGRRR